MEGECPEIYGRVSTKKHFKDTELPMNYPSWEVGYDHPLCSMNYSFIVETMKLNNVNSKFVYLAHDGRGSLNEYRNQKHEVVVAQELDASQFPHFKDSVSRKFVDMFVAMNSDFFILNPRSTYSWFVFVIRSIWGLKSVPIVEGKDLVFWSDAEYATLSRGHRWVSQTSVAQACKTIRVGLEKL